MIGITFALPSESSDLVRNLRETEHRDDLIFGRIDIGAGGSRATKTGEPARGRERINHSVAIAHTGVGAKNCGPQLETLVHKAKPKLVISSGFAGGVTEQSRAGDLILAENYSDPQLLENAQRILRDREPHTEKLFTSAAIIDSRAERDRIARASGAEAVDMETGAIAAVCNAHGIPLLSLRVISDTTNEPFPVPLSVLFDIRRQRPTYGRLIYYLLSHPEAVWRLFRFSRQIGKARAKLTDAIIALVREL